jgi:hypothetical protein
MHGYKRLALLGAALALGAAPALAFGAGGPPGSVTTGPPSSVTTGPPATTPPSNQGTAHKPTTPGPSASLPTKARAYGVYCQSESKKHVAGQHGTPFSQCVTAMAKLATGSTNSPRAACKNESKKHVAGQHGTPFSQCVSAGAKLKKDQASADSTDGDTSTNS